MHPRATCMGILPFDQTLAYTNRFDSIVRPLVETHTSLVYVDARGFYEPQRPKIDVILEMIKEASLVIVELSEKNPNVFLELGFALSCNKRLVILCEKTAWENTWKGNPPFDLQGRELLIYQDDVELKVRLGGFIAGTLHRSQQLTVSWIPDNPECHIRSAADFSVVPNATVWSDRILQFPFTIAYQVSLREVPANADVRLFIVPGSQEYPQIVCIFPWEQSAIDPTQAECHIDCFASEAEQVRLQQVSVCPKEKLIANPEWSVFVTFRQPNVVFESSLFESKVERLVVSMNGLLQRGLPLAGGFRLGFSANTRACISEVTLREVYQC
jgi:hypothetical protein